MRKTLIRLLVILLWIALIATLLYAPKWEKTPAEPRSLNVFTWGDILDPDMIAAFEKQTGINVNLSYYSSNEELIVKLRATRGEGYDLIIPSDYAVALLIQEELLKPIDKEKLNFWNRLNPNLVHRAFDPENAYSIPFEWEIYGLGIDTSYFAQHPTPPSWNMIFDPQTVHYKIVMRNDPIEAIALAAFYLYGPISSLTPLQAQSVESLLKKQKPWVEAYADFRGDYFLATKNCAAVVASSSYIWRTMRLFNHVGFAIPQEGTFITIENLAIPHLSQKDAQVYSLINFLYSQESTLSHFKTYGFFPAALQAEHIADIDVQASQLLKNAETHFDKYHFFQTLLPQQEIRNMWVEVKSG